MSEVEKKTAPKKAAKKTTAAKKTAAKVSASTYDVLVAPVITEKSQLGVENNKVTFKVAEWASKPQIQKAVESIFGVNVTKVNVLNQNGKVKKFRGFIGKRSDYKKAIVTLKEGDTIDVTAGI